jgi:uncharacterized iron-regulated membrane protein
MMRQIHRWISFPLILFLFIVTLTGVVLQVEEMGSIGGGPPAPPSTSSLPDDRALAALIQQAAATARTAKPDLAAQVVSLDFSNGNQKARFGVSPRGGASVEVDLKTGKTRVQDKPQPSLHGTMIQLHTGRMFGPGGLILMGVVSLIFLVLTATGFIVYLNMWLHRRKAGRGNLFWK